MNRIYQIFTLLMFFLINTSCFGQANLEGENEKKIKEAILDYVEGVYEADTLRIYRSVHPTLAKRGTWYDKASKEFVPFQEMDFKQLVDLTKSWNKDGNRANSKSPRDIVIFDIQEKTASAKVIAAWGMDYFHLIKMDGEWYIINVLWQTLN